MKIERKTKLLQILKATERHAGELVEEAGRVAETARNLVPVDEGDLKSTLEANNVGEDGRVEFVAGGNSKISDKVADYGRDVEFGTTHETADGVYNVPAQPFFRPGFEAGKQVIREGKRIAEG